MQGNKIVFLVLTLLGTLLFLISCSAVMGSDLSPSDYAQWVENPKNGLRIAKKMKGLEFTLQYKPNDYIIVLEEKQPIIEEKKVAARRKELGTDAYYFNFRIKSLESNSPLDWGVNDEAAYSARLAYCTFDMQQDLKLIEGQDTLPCVLFQFVRNYDIAPYLDFVLGFEKKQTGTKYKEEDKTIIFEDKTFGTGTMKFLLEKNSLKNIPLLKTI